MCMLIVLSHFFFNATATTEIYTLSLHDALPISCSGGAARMNVAQKSLAMRRRPFRPELQSNWRREASRRRIASDLDRKSTRLNSSHSQISYAVFCLKKKNKKKYTKYNYKTLKRT